MYLEHQIFQFSLLFIFFTPPCWLQPFWIQLPADISYTLHAFSTYFKNQSLKSHQLKSNQISTIKIVIT